MGHSVFLLFHLLTSSRVDGGDEFLGTLDDLDMDEDLE